jgi:hypothetical protein
MYAFHEGNKPGLTDDPFIVTPVFEDQNVFTDKPVSFKFGSEITEILEYGAVGSKLEFIKGSMLELKLVLQYPDLVNPVYNKVISRVIGAEADGVIIADDGVAVATRRYQLNAKQNRYDSLRFGARIPIINRITNRTGILVALGLKVERSWDIPAELNENSGVILEFKSTADFTGYVEINEMTTGVAIP